MRFSKYIKNLLIFILCLSCSEQFAYSQTESQQSSLPSSVFVIIGDIDECVLLGLSETEIETEFIKFLSTDFVVLERGGVHDAIIEEWRSQMSGIYDESTTVDFGELDGAEGIAMINVECNSEVVKCNVSISDVETGRRVYTESFLASDLIKALTMFSLDLSRKHKSTMHPLDIYSKAELRDSVFSFFEVDELAAMTWLDEFETTLQNSLVSYVPNKNVELSGVLTAELNVDYFNGVNYKFTIPGNKNESLINHLNFDATSLIKVEVPKYNGEYIKTYARKEYPIILRANNSYAIKVRDDFYTDNIEINKVLNQAPRGDYNFNFKHIRLADFDYSHNQLVSGSGRSVVTSLLLSSVMPGLGIDYGTYKSKKGTLYLISFCLTNAIGWGLKGLSNNAYDDYLTGIDPNQIESDYQRANKLHHGAIISWSLSSVIWTINLLDTGVKTSKHSRKIQNFVSRW